MEEDILSCFYCPPGLRCNVFAIPVLLFSTIVSSAGTMDAVTFPKLTPQLLIPRDSEPLKQLRVKVMEKHLRDLEKAIHDFENRLSLIDADLAVPPPMGAEQFGLWSLNQRFLMDERESVLQFLIKLQVARDKIQKTLKERAKDGKSN